MAIESKDVNLSKFLETFTPEFLNEEGKQVLSNEIYIEIAALLKIDFTLQRMLRK
jgi:hypothetical protein